MAAPISKRFYHPELDVLRFFAFLMVFACHASSRLAFQSHIGRAITKLSFLAGSCGVDLFFCLSAYLITEILLREHRLTGSIDVRSFYLRRILRIWPLYFFFLGFAVFAIPFFIKTEALPWRAAAMFALFVGNWTYRLGLSANSVGILWSVSIEEQFYLAWPLVVRNRVGRIWKICAGFLVAATLFRVLLVMHHASYLAFWESTFSRMDPICVGALLAVFLNGRVPRITPMTRNFIVFGGFAGLVASAHWGAFSGTIALLTYPAVAICCTAMVAGSLRENTHCYSCLIYLGRISYGLYVFHSFALRLSDQLIPAHDLQQGVLRVICAATITVAMASASYRWLETPFLRLKERFSHINSAPVQSVLNLNVLAFGGRGIASGVCAPED